MPVLNEALEAAILRDPDDLEAYAVYGDWLAEQGDPRGELIATQIAADQTADPEMQRAALRVFSKHRDYFIGRLGSMIAADSFTWRAGFIHRVVLSPDRLLIEDGARVASSLGEVVAALLAHPSARFLMELVVRTNNHDLWNNTVGSQKDIVGAIAAARPLVLRRLQLGDAAFGWANIGSLDHAWPALAPLHELVLQGQFTLGAVVLPELRTIDVWPNPFRKKLARELLEAPWPKLRTLSLHLGNCHDHVVRELVALLNRTDLPALVDLRLPAFRHAQTLIEQLSRSPLLARLQTLDLSHGSISDHGVRPILANADAFAHLSRLDLSDTAVTAKTFARLRHVLPNVVGKSP
ncbi:MAG: TIGR02996 domain-containing protein [Myxococcota bacterium]|nr:TIGR02996 domain-containing protein [Deltaproteobacteria bacterium]MDQ3337269.1 TIGR02996 domain-containing protein [Myxococcota bacterium]